MSKLYTFRSIQNIPSNIETVWDFISSPKNLKLITPPSMGFNIFTDEESKMYPGQIIGYKVSPLAGFKLTWITEITHVEEKKYFVDEQRFGPYAFWHHKHFIKEMDGGVEMRDLVNYKIPFGFLGDIANSILVERKLKEIFDFRYKKIVEYFGDFK